MLFHELHWIAGLLEGEGCFDIQKSRLKTKTYKSARVRLNMTDADVVSKAMDIIGTGTISVGYPKGNKPVYCLCITGNQAVYLMNTIEPLMGSRRMLKIRDIFDELRASKIDDQIEVPENERRQTV